VKQGSVVKTSFDFTANSYSKIKWKTMVNSSCVKKISLIEKQYEKHTKLHIRKFWVICEYFVLFCFVKKHNSGWKWFPFSYVESVVQCPHNLWKKYDFGYHAVLTKSIKPTAMSVTVMDLRFKRPYVEGKGCWMGSKFRFEYGFVWFLLFHP